MSLGIHRPVCCVNWRVYRENLRVTFYVFVIFFTRKNRLLVKYFIYYKHSVLKWKHSQVIHNGLFSSYRTSHLVKLLV